MALLQVPEFKKFKRETVAVAYHEWGDDYDTLFSVKTKHATFEVWHEEEEYGNDTHGWQSRILMDSKAYYCATKELTAEKAYAELLLFVQKMNLSAPLTKKQQQTKETLDKTKNALYEYQKKHSIHVSLAEYIGCKSCGSRLKRDLLYRSEKCPLCGNDLRSKTTQTAIDNYLKKISKLEREIAKFERGL